MQGQLSIAQRKRRDRVEGRGSALCVLESPALVRLVDLGASFSRRKRALSLPLHYTIRTITSHSTGFRKKRASSLARRACVKIKNTRNEGGGEEGCTWGSLSCCQCDCSVSRSLDNLGGQAAKSHTARVLPLLEVVDGERYFGHGLSSQRASDGLQSATY